MSSNTSNILNNIMYPCQVESIFSYFYHGGNYSQFDERICYIMMMHGGRCVNFVDYMHKNFTNVQYINNIFKKLTVQGSEKLYKEFYHKYSMHIDIDISYKYVIENTFMEHKTNIYLFYLNNKVDIHKYTNIYIYKLLKQNIIIKNDFMYLNDDQIQLLSMNGLYKNTINTDYINMCNLYEIFDDYDYKYYEQKCANLHIRFQHLVFLYLHYCVWSIASDHAFYNMKYSDCDLEQDIYDAYIHHNIDYILTHNHTPDYKCFLYSVQYMNNNKFGINMFKSYVPNKQDINNTPRERLYETHNFTTNVNVVDGVVNLNFEAQHFIQTKKTQIDINEYYNEAIYILRTKYCVSRNIDINTRGYAIKNIRLLHKYSYIIETYVYFNIKNFIDYILTYK